MKRRSSLRITKGTIPKKEKMPTLVEVNTEKEESVKPANETLFHDKAILAQADSQIACEAFQENVIVHFLSFSIGKSLCIYLV